LLKEEGLVLSTKHTLPKYIRKIGVVIGLNVEFANPCYYEKFI